MKGFARVTKLSNVGGRADYISNPDRQESIVAASEPVDWKPYHDYEMANQKTAARNNEGREVVIALPNKWAALSRDELTRRAEKLAVTAAGKSTDMQWAVHWNKAHTNLHIHVIFSERQREKEPGRWDRDIYLTDEGKVARRKADRARLTMKPDSPARRMRCKGHQSVRKPLRSVLSSYAGKFPRKAEKPPERRLTQL